MATERYVMQALPTKSSKHPNKTSRNIQPPCGAFFLCGNPCCQRVFVLQNLLLTLLLCCSATFSQELGLVTTQFQLACDRKPTAQKYLQATLEKQSCIYEEVDDLCKEGAQRCLMHGLCEPRLYHKCGPRMVVAGPPCAPYSGQRPQRFSEGCCAHVQQKRDYSIKQGPCRKF